MESSALAFSVLILSIQYRLQRLAGAKTFSKPTWNCLFYKCPY